MWYDLTIMARQEQRNVKRTGAGGRQAIVRTYNDRRWYQMADWLVDFTVDYAGWAALALVVLLVPVALLAIVLGAHSLPLEYLGVPALDAFADSNNGFGITGITLILEFVLLLLAVRPLFLRHRRGWYFVVAAAGVHLIDEVAAQHVVSGLIIVAFVAYLYWQVQGEYT
jgi:hypothetical protein